MSHLCAGLPEVSWKVSTDLGLIGGFTPVILNSWLGITSSSIDNELNSFLLLYFRALPSLLDSDEEIMTTKFEMSKME